VRRSRLNRSAPSNRWRLAALLLGSAALQACAAATSTQTAELATASATADVPGRWSGDFGPTGAAALATWWQRYGDPLLTELVDEALAANTDVVGAQAALRQARAIRSGEAATLFPQLGFGLSRQRSRTDALGTAEQYDAGVDASWEPDIFGANRSGVRAADADVRSTAADLGNVQVSIAAEVAIAYITLRSEQARLAIARENLAAQLETLQLTEWRVQAGIATSLDAEQARTASEQTRAQLPAFESSLARSRHSLAVLTGKPPADLDARLAATQPVPQPAGELTLAIPADTLRQRPDVRADEERLRAALARVDAAQAARLPSLNLSGSFGAAGTTLGALTGGGAGVTALLANLTVPLFDGGARRSQVRAQEAAFDQAQASYRASVLGALQEAEDALATLYGDRERLEHLRAAADSAANAWLLAQQRYSSGIIDFQVVLETQRTLLNAQDNVATAEGDLSVDHVRLYKALGGGWEPDLLADDGSR
jgi:NodT family efflux transporter outer membrane factor (OMF) lipoprotein